MTPPRSKNLHSLTVIVRCQYDLQNIIYTSFCTTKLHDERLENGAFDCIEKGNTYQEVMEFAGIRDYLWGLKKSDGQCPGSA